jgi:UDP-N-acetylmuramoylalanine--D-glutamate ligase
MRGGGEPAGVRPLGVRRALVIGAGASGRAAARLLVGAGAEVVLVEENGAPDGASRVLLATETGAEVVAGRPAVEVFAPSFDLVVPSPGVPEGAPVLAAAAAAGTPVWSEPELALRRHPRRLLAVTGTNGKTSVTELLTAMCLAGGHDAHACGNIGLPVSDAAASSTATALLVAELSSFQLRFAATLAPEVAVLLNLAPDHLDWHTDLASYHAAKARIFAAQTSEQWAVVGEDDPVAREVRDRAGVGQRAGFSALEPVQVGVGRGRGAGRDVLVAAIDGTTEELLPVAALGPSGGPVPLHRVANVAAAATAALLAGVAPGAAADAAAATLPGRHRFEVVATDGRGVRYIDDSKATNVHAAMAALASAGPGVWIGGGLAKGVDLRPLAGALTEVHDAVVIGAAAAELAAVCAAAGVRCHAAADLVAAVELAARLAAPGETVLLAPSCASFDQFDSYAHRGEVFTAAAQRVAAAITSTDQGTSR